MATLTAQTPRDTSVRTLWWVGIPAALVLTAIVLFTMLQPITVLPRQSPAPGFILPNQAGELVSSGDQIGRITLYSFSCGTGCEQSAATIATLNQQLGHQRNLDFITLALDGASQPTSEPVPTTWHWLTGSAPVIKAIVGGGFSLYFEDGRDFQPRYVLVDGNGLVRATYYISADVDTLQHDIDILNNEAANSTGLARLGYEAAHLFACYPE